jgi:predicted Zn finger-like uncharacterized protein
MISTTQCPSCHTRFNVTENQLSAHDGLVRCGRCNGVFNALEQAENNLPDLQFALPIDTPTTSSSAPTEEISLPPVTGLSPSLAEVKLTNDETSPRLDSDEVDINIINELESDTPPPEKSRKNYKWFWMAAHFVLLAALVLQAIYAFRVEIAAEWPRLKPAMSNYCRVFNCSIPLPHKINLFSIESSDLAADTTAPNLIILSAILRNLAPYSQAFPWIELTLTNGENRLLARRLFKPADYLKAEENEQSGLANNREIDVQLRLDTQDLKPAGYKLLLLYPTEK